jgi:hypothetical protein
MALSIAPADNPFEPIVVVAAAGAHFAEPVMSKLRRAGPAAPVLCGCHISHGYLPFARSYTVEVTFAVTHRSHSPSRYRLLRVPIDRMSSTSA